MRKSLWPSCSIERHSLETDLISSSDGFVLVAELTESKLAGFAEVTIRRDHVEGTKTSPVPYLEGWYVDPDHRGKGIGKELINTIEEIATKEGYKELASDAEIDNQLSIDIHKVIGFQEVGRSVHFIKSL